MQPLSGKTAIVTGASAGIGGEVARTLAKQGMHLVLAARRGDRLEALATELHDAGVRAVAVPTDVSVRSQLEYLVEQTVSEFGQIDLLVNNAGVEAFCRYHELDVDDIVRTIHVNLTATLVLTRLVLPHMLSQRRGHIVNMSSTAGKHGPAYGAAYGASKAGMIAFTQSLRGEYHGTGVSASAICPGFTDRGGIYERIRERTGRGTPPQMGATSTAAVARAVVKAIKHDSPEMIVNFPPMRPVLVLGEMFPSLGHWIVRRTTTRFLRRAATSAKTNGHSAKPETR